MKWWPLFRRGSEEAPGTSLDRDPSLEDGSGADDDALLGKLADKIVRMRMTVPAIFFLESSKPLAFLGGQLLIFLEPFVQTLFNFRQYQRFALLMEDRENWEKLIRKIEDLEAKYSEKETKGEGKQ